MQFVVTSMFKDCAVSLVDFRSRTKVVAEAENVRLADGGLEACVRLGNGDMRRCLNLLQSTHMGFGLVTEANVYQCAGQPTPKVSEDYTDLPVGSGALVCFEHPALRSTIAWHCNPAYRIKPQRCPMPQSCVSRTSRRFCACC
eukprot:scaffold110811_cov32-Tisochrysis_lutea.AAC.4